MRVVRIFIVVVFFFLLCNSLVGVASQTLNGAKLRCCTLVQYPSVFVDVTNEVSLCIALCYFMLLVFGFFFFLSLVGEESRGEQRDDERPSLCRFGDECVKIFFFTGRVTRVENLFKTFSLFILFLFI